MKLHKNKLIIGTCIILALGFASMAFKAPPEEHHPQNLKVLPKNIDHATLIKIMHDFSQALGYKCMNCHAMSTTRPGDMDFASDAKPQKNTAREMMKMMMKINRKFFDVKKGNFVDMYMNSKITCYSCHHGSEHPMTMPEMMQGDHDMPSMPQQGDHKMPPPPPQGNNGNK
jgi:uncharacterized Fe-S center protein